MKYEYVDIKKAKLNATQIAFIDKSLLLVNKNLQVINKPKHKLAVCVFNIKL